MNHEKAIKEKGLLLRSLSKESDCNSLIYYTRSLISNKAKAGICVKIIFMTQIIDTHLDVAAARDLDKVLLVLEGLVHLVVGRAEDAQLAPARTAPLGEHNKLGHERDHDDLTVEHTGQRRDVIHLRRVHQPEPEKQGQEKNVI